MYKRRENTVSGMTKGIPAATPKTVTSKINDLGWNLLREDLPFPLVVLKDSAIKHNSQWMQRFVEQSGAQLAPHGKTTMAPDLFNLQIQNGAWGITAATVHQVRVYREHGINHILLANQLLQAPDIEYISKELNQHPDFDFLCLIDSIKGCEILAGRLRKSGIERPLQVLLELGIEGRRTGCRTIPAAMEVAQCIENNSDVLKLCGIEGFEGLVRLTSDTETEAVMTSHLDEVVELAHLVEQAGLFKDDIITLTAGGSSHFDLVIDSFKKANLQRPSRMLIRSGCYITHDSWMYRSMIERMYQRSPHLEELGDGLRPALESWAMIQSRPELGRAICTIGKRDIGVDVLPPILEKWYRPGTHKSPQTLDSSIDVAEVHDQHTLLTVPEDCPLDVGDLVCFGISHPCTTFDKWKFLNVVDDDYNVISSIDTNF